MLHGAGRIIASTCYNILRTKIDNPRESLIAKIMQYEAYNSGDNNYTMYGKKLEPDARDCYRNIMSNQHGHLKVMNSEFHVRATFPFLGASPGGSRSCHTYRVLDIKCPFEYQYGLKGWDNDSQNYAWSVTFQSPGQYK